jgi:acetyltransferase-like isoleucine patch superfamily enzyme
MSENEIRDLKEKDRKALKEWMAGDRSRPFILEKKDRDYCVCYLLFQSITENLGLSLRCLIVWIAEQTPLSGIKIFLYRRAGTKIGKDVFISPGAVIDPIYPDLVEIDDGVVLGIGCLVLAHEYTAYDSRLCRVRIGAGSVIGAKATVRAGVTIGKKCTVGANSFVNKDVPDNAVVGGVPARIIKNSGLED